MYRDILYVISLTEAYIRIVESSVEFVHYATEIVYYVVRSKK